MSIFDRGFVYGDGVFETMRVYSGSLFRVEAHLNRLAGSAGALRIRLPRPPEQIISDIDAVLSRNHIDNGVVRVAVSRGIGFRGPGIGPETNATYIVTTDSLPKDLTERQRRGIRMKVVSVRRTPEASLPGHAKHANYLNSILAHAEAVEAGADEALMLDTSGGVAECSAANVFFLKESSLCTPSLGRGVLPGVTRSVVLELAADAGLEIAESHLSPSILDEADEVFITNSVVELLPVRSIEGRNYPTAGLRTERLRDLYRQSVGIETGCQ